MLSLHPTNDVLTDEYRYIGENVRHTESWEQYPAFMGVREFYGGDLQGVLDKMDYLEDLGIDVTCEAEFSSNSLYTG